MMQPLDLGAARQYNTTLSLSNGRADVSAFASAIHNTAPRAPAALPGAALDQLTQFFNMR